MVSETKNTPAEELTAEKSDPIADVLKGLSNHTFGFAKSNVLSMLGPEIAKLGLNPMFLQFLGIETEKEVSNQDIIDSIVKVNEDESPYAVYDNIPVLVEKSCERTRLSFQNCEFNFGTKYNYITTLTDGINIYKERTRHTGEEDVRGGEYWGT